MSKKKSKVPESVTVESPSLVQPTGNEPWVTDTAWITGIAGTLTIIFSAYYFQVANILGGGAHLFGLTLTDTRHEGILLSIGIVTLVMASLEIVRLRLFYGKNYFKPSPWLAKKQYGALFKESFKRYCLLLLLLWLTKVGYHSIVEYGFKHHNAYYQPWFLALEVLWTIYLYLGFPYILLTTALKHDAEIDKKDLATLTEKCLRFGMAKIPLLGVRTYDFNLYDKRAALGYLVKFFFCPVITVFYFDNFSTLANNFDYLTHGFVDHLRNGTYTMELFGNDFGNVATSMIFSIDVGLAWVGYVVSSRWLDNQTVSAEPTLLGWSVCLVSYPPFRVITGWFVTGPGENLYAHIPDQFIVGVFGTMMIISYFVYMLPTVWFGVRFSNLTHRGIIRKGPFAIVRHPAYASKNFAWWCVGLPASIYVMFTSSFSQGLMYIAGLIVASGIYYLRAITEERHLSFDPDYEAYCKQVKYRFIPGVI